MFYPTHSATRTGRTESQSIVAQETRRRKHDRPRLCAYEHHGQKVELQFVSDASQFGLYQNEVTRAEVTGPYQACMPQAVLSVPEGVERLCIWMR